MRSHPLSHRRRVLAAVVLAAACTRDPPPRAAGGASSDAGDPHAASAAASVASPTSSASAPATVSLPLAPQRFERARITFDGLADVAPDVTPWDVGGVFFQGRALATDDESIRLLVRAHGDETLESFERDHTGFRVTKRNRVLVCGRPADVVRASRDEEHIACVIVTSGQNHPAYIPPTDIVAIGFEHARLHVVLTIEVAAARPAAYAASVDRIVSSIRCL